MLQVLNARERNQAFLQFLLFFLLTTALIVGAIYFNFEVPEQERNQLREEVYAYRTENSSQQKFVAQMEEAKKFLDSLSKNGINVTQVNAQLTQKLTDLQKLRSTDDTSTYGKLNNVVINAFLEMQQAKAQLSNLNAKEKEIAELKRDLAERQQRLDTYIQAYPQLSTQNQ